jgi:hypothetical protein
MRTPVIGGTDAHATMRLPRGHADCYAPSGIRTRATTLKGWRPRPLVDGGGRRRIAVTRVYTGLRGAGSSAGRAGDF